jgi:hypothetical protein
LFHLAMSLNTSLSLRLAATDESFMCLSSIGLR